MVEFGFFALMIGLCLAVYGLVMGVYSLFRPVRGVILSARNALIGVQVCVLLAAVVLWTTLFSSDFSVRYAFRNSAVDMPVIYLFTAFWSALEGSHTLWTLILSTIVTIALATIRPKNEPLLPGLLVAFGLVETYMLLLTVWASAPLTRQFPVGQFGAGMNPLLQNPYMAIHPPCLFTGYSSLIVPFGYGVAALLRGAFTPEWLVTVRRWSLIAWGVLTVGIFLGGKWAYVELGWAGYWAWDPVENSSFMPWLATTASLHTLLILDKTGRLPRLAVFLGMLAFSLTFVGTFITRSGVISSVHSFAESNIGPAYLTYIGVLLLLSLGLLAFRGGLLQGAARSNPWTVSKESSLLFTNFFLLFLLALVFIGTLLPLIVEAVRGVKISIQQPFFNAFAPWVGLGLVSLVGAGNLLRWRTGRISDPLVTLGFPALWAAALTFVLATRRELDVKSTVGILLITWSAGVMVMDFVYKMRALRWNTRVLLRFNRPYLGAWFAHLGFLVALVGFLGNYRGLEAQTTLPLHGSTEFYGYKLTNDGLGVREGSNVVFLYANVHAENLRTGEDVIIQPTRSKYTNKEEWLNEVGVDSTLWHDVYLVLASFDSKTQSVVLKMHINPTVKVVWTSLVIMVLGALIALSHRIARRTSQSDGTGLDLETATASLEELLQESVPLRPAFGDVATAGVLLLIAVGTAAFGLSGLAFAATEGTGMTTLPPASDNGPTSVSGAMRQALDKKDEATPAATVAPAAPLLQLNPKVKEIGSELRCPTCQGLSVIESETPQSTAMRSEIQRQLDQGATKDEIKSYFKKRYGEWILREPDQASAVGFSIWAIPIVGLALGPVLLIWGLRRTRERDDTERLEVKAELERFLARQGLAMTSGGAPSAAPTTDTGGRS